MQRSTSLDEFTPDTGSRVRKAVASRRSGSADALHRLAIGKDRHIRAEIAKEILVPLGTRLNGGNSELRKSPARPHSADRGQPRRQPFLMMPQSCRPPYIKSNARADRTPSLYQCAFIV